MSTEVTIGAREYFPGIGKIPFEGPESKNPLAFKYYDENRVVAGKSMKDHFRFAVAYWHTFCNAGEDPFGPGTVDFPWDAAGDPMQAAKDRLDAAFEYISKLGLPFYCFHDRDMAPEGDTVQESEKNLKKLVALAKQKQEASGVRLLWGTANVFSHPRYMNGAATNPDFHVVTHVAAQVKAVIDAGLFGSLDVNQGDPYNGWDTDEFLNNLYDATELMLVLLQNGGMGKGGMNFDAKTRRSSTDLEDIFIAHISSMDTLARGLLIAENILENSDLPTMKKERYASFDAGDGAKFEKGELELEELAAMAAELSEPRQISGKQELYESIINQYIW